jgi:hypothetical protein
MLLCCLFLARVKFSCGQFFLEIWLMPYPWALATQHFNMTQKIVFSNMLRIKNWLWHVDVHSSNKKSNNNNDLWGSWHIATLIFKLNSHLCFFSVVICAENCIMICYKWVNMCHVFLWDCKDKLRWIEWFWGYFECLGSMDL